MVATLSFEVAAFLLSGALDAKNPMGDSNSQPDARC